MDYSDGSLADRDAAFSEEHFLWCMPCLAAVEDADRYVRAFRRAALDLRGEKARAASARLD